MSPKSAIIGPVIGGQREGVWPMPELAAQVTEPIDEKAVAIVNAARKTFLSRGFDAASMDHIALTAGVSKRTVYNRFRSKEELFGAAITETCQNLLPVNIDDIEASLEPYELVLQLSKQVVRGILQPEALSLRRIAAFEAERTPAIGKAFLENGPQWMVDKYAPIMERLTEKGVFEIADARQAIWQLGALITEPLHTMVLMGAGPDNLEKAIDDQVNRGVAAFMKIYSPS